MEQPEGSVQSPGGSEQPRPSEPSWLHLFIRHFPVRDFVGGGLVPFVIFSVFSGRGEPLTGVLLAGGWGMAVVLVDWVRTRRIPAFALLAVIFSAIQLVTTILTRSATVWLVSGVINNGVEGLVYLVSLWFPRSLIQIVAEATGATDVIPIDLRRTAAYRRAWQILTAIWGGTSLAKAAVLLLAWNALTENAALTLGLLMGWPLQIGLFAFTFWFPGWYWRRRW